MPLSVFVLLLALHVPALNIESPSGLSAAAARLESIDPSQLREAATLVGLDDAGPPVRVVLSSESSDLAHRVPPWVSGFAVGGELIVLFPTRAPVYPHGTLEDVLRHELAHVLLARASGGGHVPRWFNEGLAMAAERPWGLTDRTRLAFTLAFGEPLSLDQVDRLFGGGRTDQEQAYAIAGWFVRDLLDEHGRSMPARLLDHVAGGLSFEQAFARATGMTLVTAEAGFFRRQRTWTTWFPLLTSTTVLWAGIAVLALYAARRRRQRRAALRRRWEAEEGEDGGAAGPTEAP